MIRNKTDIVRVSLSKIYYTNNASNNYRLCNKIIEPKKVIYNKKDSEIMYYRIMIISFIREQGITNIGGNESKELDSLLMELDKNNLLPCLNHDLLYLAFEIIYSGYDFYNAIKMILMPNQYKQENIFNYYYLKDFFLDRYDRDPVFTKAFDKYLPRDSKRIAFVRKYLKNNKLYHGVPVALYDVIRNILVYYFDTTPVVDEKELYEFIMDFINNNGDFFDGLLLQGIIPEPYDEHYTCINNMDKDDLYLEYIEHYYDNRHKRIIR